MLQSPRSIFSPSGNDALMTARSPSNCDFSNRTSQVVNDVLPIHSTYSLTPYMNILVPKLRMYSAFHYLNGDEFGELL
ncbi:hypothetical protein J6590_082185 [Homalodisca vitripennis]|nr:hypothetical protein J6590_082185 [Homalodisca vitripennis]